MYRHLTVFGVPAIDNEKIVTAVLEDGLYFDSGGKTRKINSPKLKFDFRLRIQM